MLHRDTYIMHDIVIDDEIEGQALQQKSGRHLISLQHVVTGEKHVFESVQEMGLFLDARHDWHKGLTGTSPENRTDEPSG
jgi:hypothetical protein